MNVRTILFAFVALSLAGLTALFARHYLDSQRVIVATPVVEPTPAAVEILVARDALPAGSFVKPDQLRWQAWPDSALAPAYVVKSKGGDMNTFVGGVVRQGIAAGEPVTSGRIVTPGDRGFLAAVLTPGMRAVSVSINAETGLSGLVFPGDRVDLILSQGIKVANNDQGQNTLRRASETVLSDIRVLAIDQNIKDQNEKAAVGKTVTFEVTPKQAEVVTVAAELGKLSLSLRSLATPDEEITRHYAPTWDHEISKAISVEGITVVHGGAKAESVSVKGSSDMPLVIKGDIQ